jgi:cupin fold WbuC family metalloprotein
MQNIFHSDKDVVAVDENWLRFLKQRAFESPLRRSRLCLHRKAEDSVHEMIIVMCKDVLFRPHRHLVKTESLYIIEGVLDVILFNYAGIPEETIQMGPIGSGLNFCYRLSVPQFHTVLPHSDFVVMYETTMGPYVEGDAEFAPWSPTDPDDLRAFLVESAAKARPYGCKSAVALPHHSHSALERPKR